MSMESCGRPKWLAEWAWEVFGLVRESNLREKFRKMIRRGAEECVRLHEEICRKFAPKGPPEKESRPDLYGPPPFHLGPELSLAAKYLLSALVHDYCIDEVRERAGQHVPALNPWPELGEIPDGEVKSAATYNTLLFHNMEGVTDRHEQLIREALEAVRVDLQEKGGKRRKRKPGPKGPRYSEDEDRAIFDGWQTWKANGGERSYEKYASKKHDATSRNRIREIERAIAREQKRRRRKGLK